MFGQNWSNGLRQGGDGRQGFPGVVRAVLDGMGGLSICPAYGARVDVQNRTGDVTFWVFELVGGVHRLRLSVVATEDAHLVGVRLLLELLCARSLKAFSFAQDLDEAGLGEYVLHGAGSLLDPGHVDGSGGGGDVRCRLPAQLAHVHSAEEAVQLVEFRFLSVVLEVIPDGLDMTSVHVGLLQNK